MTRRIEVSVVGGKAPVVVEAGTNASDERPADEPGARAIAIGVTPLALDRTGAARVEVVVGGWRFELICEDADRVDLRRRATREKDAGEASGPMEIRAIIPGRIASVRVAPDDVVEAGDTLLVVEAMKMQNELRSPRHGTVARVAVGEGDTIETGDVLVVIG